MVTVVGMLLKITLKDLRLLTLPPSIPRIIPRNPRIKLPIHPTKIPRHPFNILRHPLNHFPQLHPLIPPQRNRLHPMLHPKQMPSNQTSTIAVAIMVDGHDHALLQALGNPTPEVRLIAPHTLIYTGMRWHVRAFCEKNQAYRDFVLSRLRGVPEVMDDMTEHGIEGDVEWNTEVPVIIIPDERLAPAQKAIIETDYGMVEGTLEIMSRQALVKYVLQRYQIDPKKLDPKPEAQQIWVDNLKELKAWLYD